jgi:hypothetical protein
VDLEAGAKDDTVSEQDLHTSDVSFSRSWIDRCHTEEKSNPKVCPNLQRRMVTAQFSYVNAGSQRRQVGRR